jgi:probable selenium-dependent hydroxylase accessory protein YqeC
MTGLASRPPSGLASGSLWDVTGRAQVITFIGAGGKTTCLRSITQEIDSAGQRVVATTTTKVFPEEHISAWKAPCCPPPQEQEEACFWYAKVEENSGKWIGPSLKVVDEAIAVNTKRIWVIEGDGARGRKLKCWGLHEPQIPRFSDCAVLVLDGGLWEKVLQSDHVHRLESCPDLLGYIWKAESAWAYFLRSPVFAPQYDQMSWVILLNLHHMYQFDPLQDLRLRWAEIQLKGDDLKSKPRHLRLAAGDAKEGKIQWFDLW